MADGARCHADGATAAGRTHRFPHGLVAGVFEGAEIIEKKRAVIKRDDEKGLYHFRRVLGLLCSTITIRIWLVGFRVCF